jgi:hypothetical protein
VIFQHFAPVHREGEQEVGVKVLDYRFHGARVLYNRRSWDRL